VDVSSTKSSSPLDHDSKTDPVIIACQLSAGRQVLIQVAAFVSDCS